MRLCIDASRGTVNHKVCVTRNFSVDAIGVSRYLVTVTRETEMRREFIEVRSRKTAAKRAPWAAKITKVVGGFIAFESYDDWRVWRNQR